MSRMRSPPNSQAQTLESQIPPNPKLKLTPFSFLPRGGEGGARRNQVLPGTVTMRVLRQQNLGQGIRT